jgi:hypothetical protein
LIPGDDLSGALYEIDQNLHGPGLETDLLPVARERTSIGMDDPIGEAKWRVHEASMRADFPNGEDIDRNNRKSD